MNFIQVDPAGKDKGGRGTANVRRAAMLAFRRKERLERVMAFNREKAAAQAEEAPHSAVSTSPPTPHVSKMEPESPGRFHPEFPPSNQISPIHNVTPGLRDEGSISPNEVVAKPMQGDMGAIVTHSNQDNLCISFLFNYFLSEILSIMLPIKGQAGQEALRHFWASNLLQDPLLLQAAIAHAAVHLDTVSKGETSVLAATHLTRTMNLINQRLGMENPSIDDELIQAVAMLAANSNITGDLAESQIHMDALEEMIRLRDGKDNLGSNNCLQATIAWSDTISARITRSRPRLAPKAQSSPALESPTQPPEGMSIPYKEEIFNILNELRILTSSKKMIDTASYASIPDIMLFDSLRNSLEERMLCFQHTFLTTPSLTFGDRFLETCSIASSIYTSLAFRNFTPELPNMRVMKEDLTSSLQKAEASFTTLETQPGSDTPYAKFLFWALFIGGIMAEEGERLWFAGRLAVVLPWTGVGDWEGAKGCLGGVLWEEGLLDSRCDVLWGEVEGIAGLRGGLRGARLGLATTLVY